MDNKKPIVSDIIKEQNSLESVSPVTDNTFVSQYANQQGVYSTESIEVNDGAGGFAAKPEPTAYTAADLRLSFSKRKAMVVSIVITLLVGFISFGSLSLLIKKSDSNQKAQQIANQQDINLKDADNSKLPLELQGAGESLLISGDFISRGSIKLVSNGAVTTLKSTDTTTSQTVMLPAASGTLCLDTNNCGFGTLAQIAALQDSIAAQVVPASGVQSVNNQNGSVTIQGSLNQVTVNTAGGVITLGTPQNLDANANVQFGSLTVSSLGSGFVRSTAGVLSVASTINLASADVSGILAVSNGGTGASSLSANGVLVGNGTSPVGSVVAGGAGLCLVSTVGAPSFQACPGGGGVSSVDGQTGAIDLANATGSGGMVTIDDASTTTKGIAQFDSGNFITNLGVVSITAGGVTAAELADNAVTDTKLRDSVGLSVIGRSANTAGDPSDITAGSDGYVLRRIGGVLGFGTIDNSSLNAGTYTNITGVGVITVGTWQGSAIADAYLQDNITVSSSGTVDWTALTSYPAGCAAGSAVSTLNDVPTCTAFALGTTATYIQNQFAANQAANFRISGSGLANTALYTPLLDASSVAALNVGTTNATLINLNKNVVVAASRSLTITGGASGTRPSSPVTGMLYFDTTTNQLLQWNGGKWMSDRATATKIVASNTSSQALKDAADYVADGTSDQVEINAALTAAAGGTVYLAEGTYTVDGTILVPNNTVLAGANKNTSIIRLSIGSGSDNLIENSNTSNGFGIVIRDLWFDNVGSTGGTQNGIYLRGMQFGNTNSQLTNLISSWSNGSAVIVEDGMLYRFTDNSILGPVDVRGVNSEGRIELFTGSVVGNGNLNLTAGASAGANASIGTFDHNELTGNLILTGSTGYAGINVASGNTFFNDVSITSTATLSSIGTFSGNLVNGSLTLTGGTASSLINTLSGNKITGNVSLTSSTIYTVASNSISGNLSLSAASGASNIVSFSGNRVAGTVTLTGTGSGAVAVDNFAGNRVVGAVTLDGSGGGTVYVPTISGNVFSNVTFNTITLVPANISGNSFYPSTTNAIALINADNFKITNNQFSNIGGGTNAVNINNTSDNTYLAGNDFGALALVDASTTTVHGGQTNVAGNFLIQPAGTIELMKNTNITGTLDITSNLDTNGSLTVGSADQFVLSNTGVVTSGTWNGSVITGVYGGTGQSTTAIGDLLIGAAGNTWNKLAIGANGSCLTSNGTTAIWGSCGGNGVYPSFSVHRNGSNQTISDGTWTAINWTTEEFDTNNNFNLTTDNFTPTVAGKYQFNLTTKCGGGTNCSGAIYKNGALYKAGTSSASARASMSVIVDMNGTTDYVSASIFVSGSTVLDGTAAETHFSGSLITPSGSSSISGSGNSGQVTYFNGTGTVTSSANLLFDGTALTTNDLTVGITTGQQIQFNAGAGNHSIDIGRTDGVGASSLIDFHTGVSAGNPQVRLVVTGGNATDFTGTLQIRAATVALPDIGSGNGANAACLSAGGSFLNATSTCTNPSSIAYKENVQTLQDPMSIINQLRSVSFDWKSSTRYKAGNGGSQDFGFIAQEVNNVLPQLVQHDEKGTIIGLDYMHLIPFTVGAIQQQQDQISDIQTKLNSGQFNSLSIAQNVTIGQKLTVNVLEITTDLKVGGHIITSGDAPVVVTGQGAGNGATVSVIGNDTSGTITITAGNSDLSPDELVKLTFNKSFNSKPRIVISAANREAAKLHVYYDAANATVSGFSVMGDVAPEANKTYIFTYYVVE